MKKLIEPAPHIPLRAKKTAKMRVHIFKTAWKLINQASSQESAVDRICEAAEVSKRTFFKYFSSKDDVLIYAAKAWNLRYVSYQNPKGLEGLRHLIKKMCAYNETHPEYLLGQIASIATYTQENRSASLVQRFSEVDISSLEQCILEGTPLALDKPRPPTLMHLVVTHLDEAKEYEEIGKDIDSAEWALAVLTSLYGSVLIATLRPDKPLHEWLIDHVEKMLAGCLTKNMRSCSH